ncbi:S9 family peptidase [Alkalibacillus salilacus]|uniref:Dipeptidyl aminopeptidase/acylaminoacyl peptidase n=1 Tax=Alkalibacillus salilacus TaxID=284582 RepID=A0ABT9VEH8_9BACI|nr:S9 family peptidase [Alkalibacillus salilacus]MDQ0159373.1 dipeptidyl aminopeptidase/acylaminoacyl peptidase [Alkalibacillus salilacus]
MLKFPKPTVEQFFRSYVISDFTVSPNEDKLLFASNLDGKMNVWAMNLPNHYPYLFAHHNQSVGALKVDPEGRYVIAGYDQEGDENYQLYALPPEGGLPQPLITGEEEDKYLYGHLSEDGNRLYYYTSKGNPSYLNTYVRDLESGHDTLLHEGDGGATFLSTVSNDEEAVVFTTLYANTYMLSFVKVNGETHYLTPDPENVHVTGGATFVGDDIYFVTNYNSEYHYLAKFNLQSKSFESVLSLEEESIEDLKYDKENEQFYIVTVKGVQNYLYRYDLKNGTLEDLDLPVDIVEKLHVAKSGNVYMLGRNAVMPHNIFVLNNQVWQQLTANHVLGVSSEDMVDPEIVSYESFDGMEIESLLFKAKPENDNGYTILWPHGGPQASEQKFYRAMFQCLLNRGYTIFCPNFRGSTGYGSSFVKLVEHDWGEGPRLDNVYGIEWLFDQGISSPDKLFLVGGSYGGYMALLLHGRHPEYFKAVVDIFGVSNLFTFVNSVPDHWKPMMKNWLGDPEEDYDRFVKDSPVTYLDSMERPMLVIQGAKDPRVVKEESDQIVEKLRGEGRDVDYLVLEDEGHGFSKKENEIKVYQTMLDFLEKHQG